MLPCISLDFARQVSPAQHPGIKQLLEPGPNAGGATPRNVCFRLILFCFIDVSCFFPPGRTLAYQSSRTVVRCFRIIAIR